MTDSKCNQEELYEAPPSNPIMTTRGNNANSTTANQFLLTQHCKALRLLRHKVGRQNKNHEERDPEASILFSDDFLNLPNLHQLSFAILRKMFHGQIIFSYLEEVIV